MNTILKITMALAVTTLMANADCKIFTSAATDFSALKGSDSVSLSISNIYYKKGKNGKKKMEFKLAQKAFLEFDEKAREYIQGMCAKNNLSVVYNYQIRTVGSKDWYNFYATYDYK